MSQTPTYEDFKANGQYCKSGLAYKKNIESSGKMVIGSECVDTLKITQVQNGKEVVL